MVKQQVTMKISLTPDIESALAENAKSQGLTPEKVVLNVLQEWLMSWLKTNTTADGKGTLADYLEDHIGVLSSSEYVPGSARMSEDCGKKFSSGLVKKRQLKNKNAI